MEQTAEDKIKRVQELTKAYASFSQSSNGLGNVLGGISGLVVYVTGSMLGPGHVTAAVTIGLTILWLIGKEIIRSKFYRSFGNAREHWPRGLRALHIGLVVFLSIVAVGIWLVFFTHGVELHTWAWPYLAFVAVMPWVAWRYLRTTNEFIVGVFLLCACAVTSAGGAYGWSQSWPFAVVAVTMIAVGIAEHCKYLALAKELQCRQGAMP